MKNNEPKKVMRLGFIGGGVSSAVGYVHWCSSQLDKRWEVVSGCFSLDDDKNTQTGEWWRIAPERVYDDWKKFVAEEKGLIDAVAVLTPTPTHAEIVCHLVDAGIPVICEKAMAASLRQSASIREALDRTNGFLAVTFNYSGYPMVREMRRRVQNGELGKITQIHIEMPSDGFVQPTEKKNPQAWRLSDGEIPTILLDLAVHVHHLGFFVTGLKPQSVNADFRHDSEFEGIIDDALMWVEYEEGVRASYWVSKVAHGYKNGLKIRLFGDQGSAEWYQEDPEHLQITRKGSARVIHDRSNAAYPDEITERFKVGHPSGFIEAFANLYSDIADALVEYNSAGRLNSPYVFGWDHANEGLLLLSAASESNRSEDWINLRQYGETQ